MRTHVWSAVALTAGLLSLARSAQAQQADDLCSDVLRIGLRDVFDSERTRALRALTAQRYEHSAGSYGAGVQAIMTPEGPVPTNFTFTATNSDEVNHFLHRYDTAERERATLSLLSPFASDAIAAWHDCVTAYRGRTHLLDVRIENYDPVQRTFSLHIQFTMPPNDKFPRLTLAADTSKGVHCRTPRTFRQGNVDAQVGCAVHGFAREIILLNSNYGSVSITIPASCFCGQGGACDSNGLCASCVLSLERTKRSPNDEPAVAGCTVPGDAVVAGNFTGSDLSVQVSPDGKLADCPGRGRIRIHDCDSFKSEMSLQAFLVDGSLISSSERKDYTDALNYQTIDLSANTLAPVSKRPAQPRFVSAKLKVHRCVRHEPGGCWVGGRFVITTTPSRPGNGTSN
jgi:hypothetical protein